jgi:hypothetical protein
LFAATTLGSGERLGETRLRLLADRARERVLVAEVHATRVDQLERAPVPLALHLVAVARHPRALVHDRLARAAQAVDQRGLAHIRIADDGDLQHWASMSHGRVRAGPSGFGVRRLRRKP